VVFRQLGWRAQSLGSGVPFSSLLAAIDTLRPQIFWLSVSHLENEREFLEEFGAFYQQAHGKVAVVVGGRALTESMRREMAYAAFCDNLQHLEAFVKAWKSPTVDAACSRTECKR
jgi:methanogenic corrinoid protein MtbC1